MIVGVADMRHVEHMVPFTVFQLVEDSREIEVLLKVLNRLSAFSVGGCPGLVSIDIVPADCGVEFVEIGDEGHRHPD